jgi:hypothetical protein
LQIATHPTVILRSRALAPRLEGWPRALVAHPSRLTEDGEHLRMTAVLDDARWVMRITTADLRLYRRRT